MTEVTRENEFAPEPGQDGMSVHKTGYAAAIADKAAAF